MDYEEFKAELLRALHNSGLQMFPPFPDDTLDLRTAARTFRASVGPVRPDPGSPLTVSGTLSWTWDALQAARTATSEEDLLREVFGTDEAGDAPTDQPRLRVDLKLNASSDWGKGIPMPQQSVWARWGRETRGRLESVERLIAEETAVPLPNGRLGVLGWQGQPTLEVTCDGDGQLRLDSVVVHAFQMIDLPRRWSDSSREPDAHPAGQLRTMFERMRAALHAWGEVMDHLVSPRDASKT